MHEALDDLNLGHETPMTLTIQHMTNYLDQG